MLSFILQPLQYKSSLLKEVSFNTQSPQQPSKKMISPLSEKQCGGQTAIPDSNNVYVSLSLSLCDPRLESVLRLLCSVSLYLRFSVSSASPSLCVSMFLSFCLHLCLCLCLSLCLSLSLYLSVSLSLCLCVSVSVSVSISRSLLSYQLSQCSGTSVLLHSMCASVSASVSVSVSVSVSAFVFLASLAAT